MQHEQRRQPEQDVGAGRTRCDRGHQRAHASVANSSATSSKGPIAWRTVANLRLGPLMTITSTTSARLTSM